MRRVEEAMDRGTPKKAPVCYSRMGCRVGSHIALVHADPRPIRLGVSGAID